MQKILIIDDSEFDRRMIKSAMTSVCKNVTFLELSNGVTALDMIRSEVPRLTILDIRMPKVSGWDVLEKIKADKSLIGLRVVMMSGSKSASDVEKAIENGAHGFYTKPNTRSDYGRIASDLKAAYLDFAA